MEYVAYLKAAQYDTVEDISELSNEYITSNQSQFYT
jgi:hypothetical protein